MHQGERLRVRNRRVKAGIVSSQLDQKDDAKRAGRIRRGGSHSDQVLSGMERAGCTRGMPDQWTSGTGMAAPTPPEAGKESFKQKRENH